MSQFSIKNISLYIVFIFGVYSVNAQDENNNRSTASDTLKTESVIVVKTFNPTINDAFKVTTEPSLEGATPSEKPNLNYDINSVPVASTFVPEKTKSVEVKKEQPVSQFSNYAQLAVGNFLNVNAEVFSTIEIDRDSDFTVLLEHLSSQGGIKDVELDDFFYDTGIQLTYNNNSKRTDWTADFQLQHHLYNWYGLTEGANLTANQINDLDVSHSFIDANIGSQLIFKHEVFKNANFRLRHFRDNYDSAETNFAVAPEFHVNLDQMNFKFPVTIDFLSGGFEEKSFENLLPQSTNYSYLNAGISPSLVVNFRGVNVQIGFSGFTSIDSENSETDFFIYPNLSANYEVTQYNLSLFGGITGTLIQNTYHDAAAQNVYTAPGLIIAPTSRALNVFAGIKGSLSANFGYEAQASFTRDKNKPLWQKFGEVPFQNEPTPYAVANSFNYVYDNVSISKIEAKLNYEVENSFGLGFTGTFANYNPKDQEEAWNLPSIEGAIQAHYFITPKIKASAGFFFFGSRKDINPITTDVETIDGFFDANLRLGYNINEHWQAFLMGNNLSSSNYERWLDYPVQSVQGLIGVKYQF